MLQGLLAGDDDRHGLRSDDLVVHVARAADRAHVFGRRDTPQTEERQSAMWVHQELLSLDERLSLEGRGLAAGREFGSDRQFA